MRRSSGPSRDKGPFGLIRVAAATGLVASTLALVPVATASAGNVPGAATATPPAGPPTGTVGRVGRYLTDLEGRVLFLHGASVPAGTVPGPDVLDRWAAEGFTAVRLTAQMAPDGAFPGSRAAVGAGSPDPGLDELAVAVRAFTDRGFRVVLRIDPARAGQAVDAQSMAGAVGRMSARFRGTGGLVGFEVGPPPAGTLPSLFDAVVRSDPFHLLWWEDAAPLDPAARVARNDAASYLVGWAGRGPDGVTQLAAAAESAQLGWFYEAPAAGAAPAALTRPYPAAVAGIPLSFAAEGSGSFSLAYSTAPVGGGRFGAGVATAVVLPAAAYPNGYQVRANGARVASAPGSGVLCLVAEAGAALVEVRVEPAAPGTAVPVPSTGSVSTCAAAPVAAPASGGPAGGPIQEPAAAATAGVGAPEGADDDDLALLVLFPLLGAVGMAMLAGGAIWLLRGRRAH